MGIALRGFGGGRFTLSSTHEVTCPSPACFGSGLRSLSSSRPWAARIASVCFSSQLRPSPGPPWPAGAPQLCTSVPASPGSGLSFQFPCAGLGPARTTIYSSLSWPLCLPRRTQPWLQALSVCAPCGASRASRLDVSHGWKAARCWKQRCCHLVKRTL